MDSSGCDAVGIRLRQEDLHYRWEETRRPDSATRLELVRWLREENGLVVPALPEVSDLETVCRDVAVQRFDSSRPHFTKNGSFWTRDTWEPMPPMEPGGAGGQNAPMCIGGHHRSLAVIRFLVDEATIGF